MGPVDHNQLQAMAPETVGPIDCSHPLPLWAVLPELHVLHGVNAAYKSKDLLPQPGLERASTAVPDQRTTCVATQGINREPQFELRTELLHKYFFSNSSVICSILPLDVW